MVSKYKSARSDSSKSSQHLLPWRYESEAVSYFAGCKLLLITRGKTVESRTPTLAPSRRQQPKLHAEGPSVPAAAARLPLGHGLGFLSLPMPFIYSVYFLNIWNRLKN